MLDKQPVVSNKGVINPMFRLRGHLIKGERLCIPKIEVEITIEPEVRKKKEKV